MDDHSAALDEARAWIEAHHDDPTEGMADFFDRRVATYDEHMSFVGSYAYRRFAELVPLSAESVLDLGCGTGLELEPLLERLPSLRVTGIDISPKMLDELMRKLPNGNIELSVGDYTAEDFGQNRFDAVITFESLHHIDPDKKLRLYKKILAALKCGGVYVEGDFYAVSESESSVYFEEKARRLAELENAQANVHLDTPLTPDETDALLREAGFANVKPVFFQNGGHVGIFTAVKPNK